MHAPPDNDVQRALEQGFRLDGLAIHPATGEVSGPGGREKLDPKVMDVLVFMARNANRVVTRDELLSRLWPGAVVSDDALTRCFYELRRQLSSAGGDEKYRSLIETLPKRGYRLQGSVTTLQPPAPPADAAGSRRPWLAAVAVASAVALGLLWLPGNRGQEDGSEAAQAGPHSIAVLPFADMSEKRDQGYFADGVAEEILNRLTKAGGLRVISRTSSFSLRDQALTATDIGRRLGASHVLEGSVRRSGDQIRITAQLIVASDHSHLWSETYDRGVGEVFAVQDEIAQSVADALRVTLAPGAAPKPPSHAAAYERYLAGRLFYERRGVGDAERAVRAFEEAVQLDPGYAAGWVALSGAYMVMVDEGAMPEEAARERQFAAIQKAIQLEPDLSAAHERLAQYYFDIGDFDQAREAYSQALVLQGRPSAEIALRTAFSHAHDELEFAIADAREKVLLDPVSSVSHHNLGVMLFASRRYPEAREAFSRASELSPTSRSGTAGEIARVLIAERSFDEAYAKAMQLPETDARDYALALLYHAPGRQAEADAALARLVSMNDLRPLHLIRLAEAYTLRGRKDEAFAALTRFPDSLDPEDSRRPAKMWWFRQEAGLAPFLAPLHRDPRWQELMSAER